MDASRSADCAWTTSAKVRAAIYLEELGGIATVLRGHLLYPLNFILGHVGRVEKCTPVVGTASIRVPCLCRIPLVPQTLDAG